MALLGKRVALLASLLVSRGAALRTHSWHLSLSHRPYRAAVILSAASDEELPALPDRVDTRTDQTRTIDVNGVPLTLDELGPIVIQENGKMGRLSNWHDMTEQVRCRVPPAALRFGNGRIHIPAN
eukprot:6457455-Prymnesium_polylepis.1